MAGWKLRGAGVDWLIHCFNNVCTHGARRGSLGGCGGDAASLVLASALSPCMGRQGAAQLCMPARGTDMTAMTHHRACDAQPPRARLRPCACGRRGD